MKKILFVSIVFLGHFSMAKIADFNSLIQAQASAQKEIHNSLNEEIQVIEISSLAEESKAPEIILLGTGHIPNSASLAQKNEYELLKSNNLQDRANPIIIEQSQFKRLDEELGATQ
ncbi:hypothetical protein K2P97_02840 [bacterium]|nr:hypothetical protein [bacterium]